jgi:hypothetical protein
MQHTNPAITSDSTVLPYHLLIAYMSWSLAALRSTQYPLHTETHLHTYMCAISTALEQTHHRSAQQTHHDPAAQPPAHQACPVPRPHMDVAYLVLARAVWQPYTCTHGQPHKLHHVAAALSRVDQDPAHRGPVRRQTALQGWAMQWQDTTAATGHGSALCGIRRQTRTTCNLFTHRPRTAQGLLGAAPGAQACYLSDSKLQSPR